MLTTATARAVQDLADNARNIKVAAVETTDRTKETAEALKWQVQALNAATEQALGIANAFKGTLASELEDIARWQSSIHSGSNDLVESLKQQGSLIDDAGHQVKRHADYLAEVFESKIKGLEGIADKARLTADETLGVIGAKYRDIDTLFARQQETLNSASDRLSRDAESLNNVFGQQQSVIAQNADSLTSRFKVVEEGLAVQSRELSTTSSMVVEKLNEVYNELKRQSDNLIAVSDASAGRLNGLI